MPGIRSGNYIFLSGMGPIDPDTGERRHGPIGEQIRLTLSNMQHMLESAGSSMDRVLRVATRNVGVHQAMSRVFNLQAPPMSLFKPSVLVPVLLGRGDEPLTEPPTTTPFPTPARELAGVTD